MGRIVRWGALTALGISLLAQGAQTTTASTPALGLSDDPDFLSGRYEERELAFETASQAGARFVRITLDWSLVAPGGQRKPPGFKAADPADPSYRWGHIDHAVRHAAAQRLKAVLVVVQAPAWAEDRSRPDTAELATFMRAAARRFSGFYPDPTRTGDALIAEGQTLPEVSHWQVWSEPNRTLQPAPGAVEHYRRMLNAAATALRRVAERNLVIAGGTAPTGAVGPHAFWRRLLCCGARPRFDIAAHTGLTRLDALRRVLTRAGRSKPLWLSPVGRDSRPRTQARSFVEGLFLADSAGVRVFFWKRLKEPTLSAFKFPFLIRRDGQGLRAWGIAPRQRRAVAIERRSRGGWRRVAAVNGSSAREFDVNLTERRGVYRARQGQAKSLPWRY